MSLASYIHKFCRQLNHLAIPFTLLLVEDFSKYLKNNATKHVEQNHLIITESKPAEK
jgi:hypothetical protein